MPANTFSEYLLTQSSIKKALLSLIVSKERELIDNQNLNRLICDLPLGLFSK